MDANRIADYKLQMANGAKLEEILTEYARTLAEEIRTESRGRGGSILRYEEAADLIDPDKG